MNELNEINVGIRLSRLHLITCYILYLHHLVLYFNFLWFQQSTADKKT